jgi:[acyl-carrier-protein] S-malonyltransferase
MLPVSGPFHSPLMMPAQLQLEHQLQTISFHTPRFPVAANVDASLLLQPDAIRDALIRQVTGAVRWVDCIQQLQLRNVTHFIEVGPGKVLSGLNRQIDKSLLTTNVEDPASLEKTLAALTATPA